MRACVCVGGGGSSTTRQAGRHGQVVLYCRHWPATPAAATMPASIGSVDTAAQCCSTVTVAGAGAAPAVSARIGGGRPQPLHAVGIL